LPKICLKRRGSVALTSSQSVKISFCDVQSNSVFDHIHIECGMTCGTVRSVLGTSSPSVESCLVDCVVKNMGVQTEATSYRTRNLIT
jgi:hypothetical protein